MHPSLRAPALWMALALAPAGLAAYGGSIQAGLDGTQPWDTVPQKEADLELWGLAATAGRPGAPACARG